MSAHADHSKAKQWVAISSVLAAVFLTGTKLGVGLWTNSLGILSEAAHSGLDLVAALLTVLAVRLSDKPADSTHPYGHGKVEALSAFIQVALLLATCGYIIWEAVERLAGKTAEVEVTVYSFVVMGLSIVIDVSRSRVLSRAAKKYQSQALEADALHFSTDILSSLVVIVGLACVQWWHFPLGDALAALVVAGIVIVICGRLGKRTIDVLMDKAPAHSAAQITAALMFVPGVVSVDKLRLRTAGSKTFVDLCLGVAKDLPLVEAHAIAEKVETKIGELIPGADVLVHTDPAAEGADWNSKRQQVLRLIQNHREMFLGYHALHVFTHKQQAMVNFHLLMNPELPLAEAHAVCDHLEKEIRTLLPGAKVTIHPEPATSQSKPKEGK
jgi:cation diffusion facilitator family transporter